MKKSNAFWDLRCAMALLALCTASAPAAAGNFDVTSAADSGAGSLRLAINNANLMGDDDTITFNLPAGSTITLLSALPTLTSSVTWDATGNPITIDGSDAGITQPWLDTNDAPQFFEDVSLAGGTVNTAGFFGGYSFEATGPVGIGSAFTGDAFAIDKSGSGTATITNTVALPSAFAFVSDGTLELLETGADSSLVVDSLTVLPGATLAGHVVRPNSGYAASLIDIQGRLAPSTTAGRLPIFGETNFASGSTFEVDILPGNDGDRVDVTGDVVIESGAQLVTLLDPNAFPAPSTVTVLTSTTGITGAFDFDGSGFLFLDQSLIQDATSITIQITPLTNVDISLTPNQQHVLDVVNSATPDPNDDLATVQSVLGGNFVGTASDYQDLLDAIGGEDLTALATGRQLLGERTARALHRRARDPGWGEAQAIYATDATLPAPVYAGPAGAPIGWRAAAPTMAPAAEPDVAFGNPRSRNRVGAWVDAFGQFGELDGDGSRGSADVDSILFGGTLGVDVWLAEKVVLGLAAGYARSDLELDGREGDITGDTIQGALYGGFTDPRGYLSAYGRYAMSFQDSDRRIQSTQLSRTASASWDAEDWGAGAEAGFTLFTVGDFGFQPIAGVDWLSLTEEDYRESGAGSLSLDVDPDDLESTTGRFGARIFGKIDLEGIGFLVPELRGFWQREFGDRDRVLRARLIGASTGGALVVHGAEMPRDVVILGVGWSGNVGERIQILLDYDALLDADRVEHQGNLAVRVSF